MRSVVAVVLRRDVARSEGLHRLATLQPHIRPLGHTRTPSVAAVYVAPVTGTTPREALGRVVDVLPSARPGRSFVRALEELCLGS